MAPKTTTSTARALLLQKYGMEKKKKGSAISNISICNQTYEYIITEDKNVHVNAKESKQYCWKGAFSCSLFLLKHIPVLDGIICQGSSGTLLWLCVILTYKKDMTQQYNVVTLSIVNSVRSIINNTNHSFAVWKVYRQVHAYFIIHAYFKDSGSYLCYDIWHSPSFVLPCHTSKLLNNNHQYMSIWLQI